MKKIILIVLCILLIGCQYSTIELRCGECGLCKNTTLCEEYNGTIYCDKICKCRFCEREVNYGKCSDGEICKKIKINEFDVYDISNTTPTFDFNIYK